MLNPAAINPEWLAIGALLSLVFSAVFFSLATFDADTVAKRIALALAVTCVLAALALSALFVSYPVEAAGYDTFEPAFDCVRRAGEDL